MTSRYAKPTVKKDLPYESPSSVAASSPPASIPSPSIQHMSSTSSINSHSPSLPPPPYTDHILSIPASDTSSPYSSFASATAGRSDTHRRRQKKWNGQQYDYDDDSMFLPHDKLYKAEQQKVQAKQYSRKRDWRISIALFIWALYIRCWHIWEPSSVVFDEVHFGGFASKYIKTRFFMDVHPPLAKMMIALVAKLAGFDGSFGFKQIGDEYIEAGVPYITMRVFCALNGVLVVPIAYWTMRGCGHSISAAVVASLMVCYENGLIANNRLILLDPPLLFFTAATTLMWVNFHNQDQRPFQFWWWTWLAMTGLGLGLTVSCKWVGLFTIATIGVSTVNSLWQIWGDTRVPMHRFLRHFGARALCLIIIPITIYMLMFGIHFVSLPNTGEGDGFMSPEFQQTLDGRTMEDSPIDVAYGSKVYIRHEATHGGYLHSHPHDYPSGSKQQQVTLYPHRDDNNWWVIHKQNSEQVEGVEYVKNGDIIRLKHNDSAKRLHSHNHRPPMTDVDYHNEVSVYGFPDFDGDANDLWRVEIIGHDKKDPISKERLRTIHTRFRLIHVMERCALFSHNVKLPDWGWGQQEVTCIKNGKIPKSVWYIESNTNQLLPPDTKRVSYRTPGFIGKFLELNKVMWETNKGLVQSHPFDSRPQDWPFLRRGINFWGKNFKHIYLLGNPFVYWASTGAVISYIVLKLIILLLDKRGFKTDFRGLRQFYENSAGFFVIGWFFHYFPFFLMGRQLFLHHYMPALYFSILTFSVGFDLLTIRLIQRKRLMAACGWLLVVIYVYRCFVPLTYGEPWTKTLCEKAKWRTTWDFDCGAFHDKISDYADHTPIEIAGAFNKIQNAFKSYMAKDENRELAPEVADMVNKISDAMIEMKQETSTLPTGIDDLN
ncbi:Dolichyl-phosphate-mannose-protein mannosyltransferase-domain-containing protein [Halteromyces radiatus]|uniref:Dolichyl-phosphate-mannose-protein mannosyltransferase-domain-containing protein n=1 Tax=Halteromyces radiatus TaxID=101107 RepID=UPI002220AECA|nr:Dolichyl-phosphate-mannose-protein mannosyltransferase-domain-containing protein [Halteromyces radiatus]KAI8098487.1 Dolichyl-phosphate-mannose-protein mannosyltransferase-domain-containing protein [Halteromyces radiatus]